MHTSYYHIMIITHPADIGPTLASKAVILAIILQMSNISAVYHLEFSLLVVFISKVYIFVIISCIVEKEESKLEEGTCSEFVGLTQIVIIFVSPAGSPASLPCWCSVSSLCVSGTEEKPLTGFLTSTCCPLLTPAPPISQMMSWLFCLSACRDGL